MWSGEACSALGAWPHPCHTVSRSTREIAQAVRRDVDAGAAPSCTLILRNRRSHCDKGLLFPSGDTSAPQGPGRESPAGSRCCVLGLWLRACGLWAEGFGGDFLCCYH